MTTSPAHTGRKHNRPKLLYVHILSVCVTHTDTHRHTRTHTHTGPCTQDKSDRQRLHAELRLLPFHSGFHRAEIIHCVQVDPAIRELTRQAASERVRLCQTDRQTDRQTEHHSAY